MALFPRTDEFNITPRFTQRAPGYGLGLGVLGSILFLDIQRPGLPMLIWLIAFALTAIALAKRVRPEKSRTIILWSLQAIAAAAMLVVYLNPVTITLMFVMILLASAIVLMELRGSRLCEVSVYDFLVSCLRLPPQALTGCFILLGNIDIKAGIKSANNPTLFAILRGLIIALPLMLILGALFSSADASFERVFNRTLQFFGPDMPEHIVLTFCIGWMATGLLISIASKNHESTSTRHFDFRLGEIETTVVMGMLLTMYLVFVGIQLPNLFGGKEIIEHTSGLTLADYARRGFFELLAVSVITLTVLLLLGGTTNNRQRFRPLALALLACLILIMISAAQRLLLYMDSFDLTLARLSAAIFMLWLGICLLLVAFNLIRNTDKFLVAGAVYSAVLLAFALALSSPPQFIANFNITRAKENSVPVDFQYLQSLGAETVPVLLNEFDRLPEYGRCQLARRWVQEFDLASTEKSDWRNWNLGYERARNALSARSEELIKLAADCCASPLTALANPTRECSLYTF